MAYAETGLCAVYDRTGPFSRGFGEYLKSDRAELEWNIEYHKQRGTFHDFAFPNIKPNLGIGVIAEAFGCKGTPNEEADPG